MRWAVLMALGVAALVPASAQAAISAGMTMSFPISVSEGQKGLSAWIALHNLNSPPDTTATNSVCNAGEKACLGDSGVIVVPSCKQIVNGVCTAAGADPGVLTISPTATGRAGTACAGVTFTTSVVDSQFGTVLFAPPPLSRVTLPSTSPTCTIDFTVDVAKAPTGDVNPDAAGTQIGQTARHTQFFGTFSTESANASGIAALAATTLLPPEAPPPPCADCDDDGYLPKVDCNDIAPAIHPGAFDSPGNLIDEDCDGRDGTFPSIGSTLSYAFAVAGRSTRFTSLVLRLARADTTVHIRCTGGGCRFESKTRLVKQSHARADLSSMVRASRLRPGAKLEISVTRPGTIGLRRTLTVRSGKRPIQTDRCLVPGQSQASACAL